MSIILRFVDAIIDLIGFCPAVAMVQSGHSLRQYFPNEILAYMVRGLSAPPYQLLEVAAVAVLHNYKDLSFLFVYDSVVVLDDISVAQLAQYIDFRNNLLFFFLAHDSVIEFFPDQHFAV